MTYSKLDLRFKKILCVMLAITTTAASLPALSDVAVRSAETSETEFQALAQALGHTPISDFLTSEDRGRVSAEMTELFRARLVEAQAAWVNPAKEVGLPVAIARFLELATESDWGASERLAFETFFVRALELNQSDTETRRKLRAFTLGALPREVMSPALAKRWTETDNEDRATWIGFTSALPVDIVGAFINGRFLVRQDLGLFRFARTATRVTFVSNVYLPLTVRLAPEQTDWPTLQRQPWIAADCAITRPADADSRLRDAKMKVLGLERCQTVSTVPKMSLVDREAIEKFGLSPRPTADSFPTPVETEKAWHQKTWVWAVAGAIALGAAIVISRQSKSDSPQPTQHDGW